MPQTSSSESPSTDASGFADPAANLREQALMHASTASACLRKLSDCVNSVSKHHADSRSIMLLPCLKRDFAVYFWFSPARFTALCILTLTSTCYVPQIVSAVGISPPI